MTTTSRWSAGPGSPGLLLDLLTAEGWTAEPDTYGKPPAPALTAR
jgi:hypothetical protein